MNREDGVLSISEIGFTESADNFAEGYGKFAVGAWFYSSKFEKFTNDQLTAVNPTDYNYGVYALAEKFLFGESADKSQGLSAFFRVGYANSTVNPFDGYLGAGITYTGLINGRDADVLGFAVAIVENDSVIFSKGFGIREINSERPVDKNTQFVTASCSKAFTTAALAILIDQNKMQWDDKVTKFIPTFKMYDPWVTNEMTIRDLVTHRSGLATFSGDFLWISSTYNPDEIINRAQYLKPVSSFRTKYGYQNIMFITAAQIIKAVTDSSWSEFLSAHILNKIGMNNSSTNYKEFYANENSAKGHYFKDDKAYTYKETQQDNAQGAIGINSSASDMAKWIKLQLAKGKFENTNIISEKQINEMWSNQFAFGNNNYGLGWFITYKNGKKLISHGGGMPGYISDVTLVPEEKFGFVILSNAETGMVNSVKNYIIDIMTNVEPKDYEKLANEGWTKRLERYEKEIKKREEEKVKNTKASLSLEKYCGVFEDKMYGNAEISIKNEKLFLQFNPTPTFRGELKHYQYDTFSIDWEDEFLTRGWLKFDFDFSGNVESFTMEVPNSPDFIFTELMFKKINKK